MNQQYEMITISFRIEDIKYTERTFKIEKGINVIQAKKRISKNSCVPMSELYLVSIIPANGGEEYAQDAKTTVNTQEIKEGDTLIFRINQFVENQLNFQIHEGVQSIGFAFNVYPDDSLSNLRAKIWVELKLSSPNKYEDPRKIKLSFQQGKSNEIVVEDEDYGFGLSVSGYITQRGIKQVSQANKDYYFLQISEKRDDGSVGILVLEQIFSTEIKDMLSICFSPNIISSKQDIENLLIVIDNSMRTRQEYQPLYQHSNQNQLLEFFKNNTLLISYSATHEENQINLIEKIEKEKIVLQEGSRLYLTLLGLNSNN